MRAIQQTRALVALVRENIEAVDLMARNAELERQLAFGIEGQELRDRAADWPESPQGRKLVRVAECLAESDKTLETLERAAAYDPKSRAARR